MAGHRPDAGDIVWLDFTPQAGHEQAGRRPALVLSERAFNTSTGMVICCPLTTQIKGLPFEVQITAKKKSVALTHHVKSLDWNERNLDFAGRALPEELDEVRQKVATLIGV